MAKIKNDKVEEAATDDLILEQLKELTKELKEMKIYSKQQFSYLDFLNDYIAKDKFLLGTIIVLLFFHILIGG